MKLESSKFTEETGVTGNFDIAISGWSVNPDPRSVMATHCAAAACFRAARVAAPSRVFCDDDLRESSTRTSSRSSTAPSASTSSSRCRSGSTQGSDHRDLLHQRTGGLPQGQVTSITPIPEDKGLLYGGSGYWPFYTVTSRPRRSPAGSTGGGSNTGLIAGIVGAVVVVGAAAFFLTRRRKSTADERE
ncbi:hypothetical protein GCM10020220_051340 [Nonomuraea rubra]